MQNLFQEKNLRLAFIASLIFKGIIALVEAVGGVLALVVSQQFILDIVRTITQEELVEDPHDLVANYLLHGAQYLSIGTQHFAALYLLTHGLIKLWLIAGLLRNRLWYYPTAMVVFGLFIIYQIYSFSHSHSAWLLVITLVDIAVIALTWHEYAYVRELKKGGPEVLQ